MTHKTIRTRSTRTVTAPAVDKGYTTFVPSIPASTCYMPRPALVCFIVGLLCTSVYLIYTSLHNPYHLQYSISGMSKLEWSSKYSGYLQRADHHPNPHSYSPQPNLLTLVGLRNAPTEPEGFSLAVFSDRVAIDMKGNAFVLSQADYDGIVELAQTTESLPKTGKFRNQWRVRHEITSRPIDRILCTKPSIPTSPAVGYDGEFSETSVYGFDKHKLLLQTPVDSYSELPRSLWELTGLVLEARETPGDHDTLVLQRVRSILENVF